MQAPKAMDTTGLKGMMNAFGQAARPASGRGAPVLLLSAPAAEQSPGPDQQSALVQMQQPT